MDPSNLCQQSLKNKVEHVGSKVGQCQVKHTTNRAGCTVAIAAGFALLGLRELIILRSTAAVIDPEGKGWKRFIIQVYDPAAAGAWIQIHFANFRCTQPTSFTMWFHQSGTSPAQMSNPPSGKGGEGSSEAKDFLNNLEVKNGYLMASWLGKGGL